MTKRCARCKKTKSTDDFRPDRSGRRKDGLHPYCISCKSKENKQWRLDHLDQVKKHRKATRARDRIKETEWRRSHPETLLWRYARNRAKQKCVPFTISVDDVKAVWPQNGLCPVFGFKLENGVGVQRPESPTLDAFIPSLGYIPANICVISYQANVMKTNVTDPRLFERLAEWMKARSESRS